MNEFEVVIKLLKENFNSMDLSFREDIAKSDNNIKALWDSFTLFTSTIHSK